MLFFQVLESKKFETRFDSYRSQFPLMSDVHRSITWRVGTDPIFGNSHQVRETNNYIYKTTGFGETPSFWVLYEVDFENMSVVLLQITVATIPEE